LITTKTTLKYYTLNFPKSSQLSFAFLNGRVASSRRRVNASGQR